MVINMRSIIAAIAILFISSAAFAQQTVVGGPGAAPSTGGGTPGGSTTQLQYNNGGSFGGISTLTNVAGVITNSASATGATLQLTGTETPSTSSAMLYVDPLATAATTFNASGTLIGANAPAAFGGDLINLKTNNASQFFVGAGGNVTFSGAATFSSSVNISGSSYFARNAKVLFTTQPTAGGTGMGTSPGAAVGPSSLGFTITVGTTPASATFTLTFTFAAQQGYICRGTDLTNNAIYADTTAFTSTTVTTMQAYSRTTGIATAFGAGDSVAFLCAGS